MLNTTSTIAAVIGILISFLYSPSIVASSRLLDRLYLPASLTGPESLAFDAIGGGPYTGVSDGRILKYDEPNGCFVEFAHTSPDRNNTMCDGISDFSTLQETCGRPLGLSFNQKTWELYIADAYFGLVRVASDGGAATQLVSNDSQGNPFGFLAGLDVDPQTGIVYFTEASSGFKIRDFYKSSCSGRGRDRWRCSNRRWEVGNRTSWRSERSSPSTINPVFAVFPLGLTLGMEGPSWLIGMVLLFTLMENVSKLLELTLI